MLTQRAKVQQHLVGAQILCDHIVRVHRNDGQTQEQMKVVGQVVRPAGLPHANGHRFGELALETTAAQMQTR